MESQSSWCILHSFLLLVQLLQYTMQIWQAKHLAENAHLKAELFKEHDIKFYSVGPDNFFFYDFFAFHLMIIFIPIYFWTANEWRMSVVNKYRMTLVYLMAIMLIWTFNVISKSFSNEWKSNNWYIGPNEHNDYSNAMGWLSGWPQNLFIYSILGIVLIELGSLIAIALYKNRREEWKNMSSQYNKFLFGRIFNLRDREQGGLNEK